MFVRSFFSGFRRTSGSVLKSVKTRAVPALARRRAWVGAAALGAGLCASVSVAFAKEPQVEKEPVQMLSPEHFQPFEVTSVFSLNHDSNYVMLKGQPQPELEFPVASFVLIKTKVGGKEEIRPYTPIAVNAKDGTIVLAVKNYKNGVVSKRLAYAEKGDKIEIKGPLPKIPIAPNSGKHIVMICGGSGVTPMMQILRFLQANKDKETRLTIIDANHTADDIWFQSYFDTLAAANPIATVHHFLTKPPAGWKGHTGRITVDKLKEIMPRPQENAIVFVCGPPSFMKDISGPKTKDYKQGEVEGMLKELGFSSANVYKF